MGLEIDPLPLLNITKFQGEGDPITYVERFLSKYVLLSEMSLMAIKFEPLEFN